MRTLFLAMVVLGGCGETEDSKPEYGGEVGQVLPELKLLGLDGQAYSTSQLRDEGQEIGLLYVTATWCFTCGPEIDWINERLAEGDLAFAPLTIVVEDEVYAPAGVEAGQAFVQTYGPEFRTVADPDQVMSPYRDANAIPLNLVLELATMKILHRSQGFTEEDLRAAIEGAN